MARIARDLTFGFPRMHRESGERRDFLPPLVGMLADLGCHVFVESGIGSGMGYVDRDYTERSPLVHVVDNQSAFAQDVVVILRAPRDRELGELRLGATLVSMLHFPTRPRRARRLRELGIEAIALDQVVDEEGRRLVENARAVAWNGLDAAFGALEVTWPGIVHPARPPVRVLVLGAGEIGRWAVEAATKYGSLARNERYEAAAMRGVEVVTVGRNLSCDDRYLRERLRMTDLLVDATKRHDPSVPVIRNACLGLLPAHAIICDLVVDPYDPGADPPGVRGIEGIPEGDLDRYVLDVDDPAWELVPHGIPTKERRMVASCYSWPGVHPLECMELYGSQLAPLLETLATCGGIHGIRPENSPFERALDGAGLRAWLEHELARV